MTTKSHGITRAAAPFDAQREIPKCVPCRREYRGVRAGIVLEVIVKEKPLHLPTEHLRPYYKVHADLWKCPGCGHEIYHGFGRRIYTTDPTYAGDKADETIYV